MQEVSARGICHQRAHDRVCRRLKCDAQPHSWQFWAVLAAAFAALTAIFAKVGVAGVPSDYATFVRTIVIALAAILTATGQWRSPHAIPPRALLFLILSGLATGSSWICYFRALQIGDAARVAPIDKLSVVLVSRSSASSSSASGFLARNWVRWCRAADAMRVTYRT